MSFQISPETFLSEVNLQIEQQKDQFEDRKASALIKLNEQLAIRNQELANNLLSGTEFNKQNARDGFITVTTALKNQFAERFPTFNPSKTLLDRKRFLETEINVRKTKQSNIIPQKSISISPLVIEGPEPIQTPLTLEQPTLSIIPPSFDLSSLLPIIVGIGVAALVVGVIL